MALTTRNKTNTSFSSASMSDLVFLLLIFFILISTMVSPNAVKLLLPNSNSKTMAKQSVTVYIDDQYRFYVGEQLVGEPQLQDMIYAGIGSEPEASVVLRADKSVPVQYIVNVIDAVNGINEQMGTRHKVILATTPKSE